MAGKELPVGVPSNFYAGMDFLWWALNQHQKITHHTIQKRFDCSRATAYRYLSHYNDFVNSKAVRKSA
jgi:hypothetical protein